MQTLARNEVVRAGDAMGGGHAFAPREVVPEAQRFSDDEHFRARGADPYAAAVGAGLLAVDADRAQALKRRVDLRVQEFHRRFDVAVAFRGFQKITHETRHSGRAGGIARLGLDAVSELPLVVLDLASAFGPVHGTTIAANPWKGSRNERLVPSPSEHAHGGQRMQGELLDAEIREAERAHFAAKLV